jgi:cytochrome c1
VTVHPTRAGTATAIGIAAVVIAAACGSATTSDRVPGGNPTAGRALIVDRYGCGSCHVIGGIDTANGRVGPPLTQFAQKQTIAGRFPATTQSVERWIQHPQELQPGTIMPDLGVTPQQAKDIAAYLYTQ